MGKTSQWISKILGHHRRRRDPLPNATYDQVEANKRAIAVAAATAAVAEAALAAANAAAEVVRLTTLSGHVSRRWLLPQEDVALAAVRIQSAFRGYLARRALRALKALVKLQALVRGHFVRKQSTEMLRRLQALVRVQDRARANRAHNLETTHHSRRQENLPEYELDARNTIKLQDPSTKRNGSISSIRDLNGCSSTRLTSNWLDKWVESGSSMNSPNSQKHSSQLNKGDKILKVDSWKPKSSKHISVQDYYNRSFAASDYLAKYSPNDVHRSNASPCTNNDDVTSLKSLHFPLEVYTAESSPPQAEASSIGSKSVKTQKSPMTPMRNEYCRRFWNGCQSPSYMANTESSRAKSRSYSVPKHRGESGRRGLAKRSLQAFWEISTSSKRSAEEVAN